MDETLDAGITDTAVGTETETVNSEPQVQVEQTFTKDQVKEMMRKRVQRSHNSFFNRYGVKDLNEMDNLFGQAKGYAAKEQELNELNSKYGDLTKRYGYKSCNIDESKIQDIETYFKGKGIEINEDTLREELKTHPDWVHKVATIEKLGAEVATQSEDDGKAEAERIFGVKLR